MTKAHFPPEARRFRDTIGLFATGVAVVVARAEPGGHTGQQEVLAMTVNAVSSVSLEPMLVMFCPGKKSKLARHIAGLSGFTINVLRHDHPFAWCLPIARRVWRAAWPRSGASRTRSLRWGTIGW
jgi:flavin reductase (DIM6/NTAB) family NADH-FMN oxidoreductase RutF